MSLYEYRAQIIRIVDGDTVHAEVQLGCDVRINLILRLYGINAPEMKTPEGQPAKAHLIELVGSAPLTIRTVKDKREKYGRYLATLIRDDGVDINQSMLNDGYAVEYMP